MPKRITTIVGAGAVLDFDFAQHGLTIPSTENITKDVRNIVVQGFDKEHSDVIQKVYDIANEALNNIYRKRNLRNYHYELNFEELYYLLESMLSLGTTGIEYYDPHGYPLLSTVVNEVEELKKYPNVEYARALHAIVKKIIAIIDEYDIRFRGNSEYEQWYREFWKGKENVKYDVFTFNYDTTIEASMDKYEDGFLPIQNNSHGISYFSPKQFLKNPNKVSTIQHLHGCIYYAESFPLECTKTHSNRDMFKMRTVDDALAQIGMQQKNQTQDKEMFLNAPILLGLRKLDKMTNMPSSIYHADLVNKLLKNKGLLIVGYSFGDLYVNQLLQRRFLMKGDKHRLIIIDQFPRYISSDVDVYHYMVNDRGKLMHFLKPFMNLRFEDTRYIKGITFTAYDEPIYSEDRHCILFICGFKRAVENHRELIWRFL